MRLNGRGKHDETANLDCGDVGCVGCGHDPGCVRRRILRQLNGDLGNGHERRQRRRNRLRQRVRERHRVCEPTCTRRCSTATTTTRPASTANLQVGMTVDPRRLGGLGFDAALHQRGARRSRRDRHDDEHADRARTDGTDHQRQLVCRPHVQTARPRRRLPQLSDVHVGDYVVAFGYLEWPGVELQLRDHRQSSRRWSMCRLRSACTGCRAT